MGLGLISEANHYNAWIAAGRPGSDNGYSADSVQLICSDSTFYVQQSCNAVIQTSNKVYNSLLTQFQNVGAPYTGEDLLFQTNTNGENVVWVRSLEDYTAQSGANCNYPLNINNLCGPTVGKFGSTLSFTTYYGTQNFIYPGLNELNGLVNPTPTTNGKVGDFLDSVGFENMNVNPPKVLIADTLVKLKSTGNDFNYYIDTMTVIPYISPGYPVFTVKNSHGDVYKRAIYSELYDFITISMIYYTYKVISSSACPGEPWRAVQGDWKTTNSPSPYPWNGNTGYIQFCQDQQGYSITDIKPFTWSNVPSPGWSYYSIGSAPQDAFFIPVRTNFTGSTGCLSGNYTYMNVNSVGFITRCGEDFQPYLTNNLPIPPTCSDPNVSPPCTLLP